MHHGRTLNVLPPRKRAVRLLPSWACICLVLLLIVAACSAGDDVQESGGNATEPTAMRDDVSATESGQGDTTTTQDSVVTPTASSDDVAASSEVSPQAISPYFSEPIELDLPSGWSYVLTANLGQPTVEFGKDIETSPPGKARLTSVNSIPPDIVVTLEGNTPGRQPPEAFAHVDWIFIPLPGLMDNSARWYSLPGIPDGTYLDLNSVGNCDERTLSDRMTEDFGAGQGEMNGFICSVTEVGPGASADLDEPVVDAILSALESRDLAPVVMVNIRPNGGAGTCGVLFYPDGTYLLGSGLSDERSFCVVRP